jgi:hypothetical protein
VRIVTEVEERKFLAAVLAVSQIDSRFLKSVESFFTGDEHGRQAGGIWSPFVREAGRMDATSACTFHVHFLA